MTKDIQPEVIRQPSTERLQPTDSVENVDLASRGKKYAIEIEIFTLEGD